MLLLQILHFFLSIGYLTHKSNLEILTPDIGKAQATPELFRFLMRGGDSEFINYLKYILQVNCVHSVSKTLEKNKIYQK